ncbi:zinc finger MYM-type protein 5-like [Daphnia magna]|uniref:zinc finger MYM-type protein 5-like n=1 Tax=Daphnia magna TaxID=35525 RepID=UPI001E1BAAB4|nr:zinc finger MYM-type protein 5-like [Daphnia magna]
MSDQQVKKRLRQSGSQYRLQKQRRSEENSKQGSALLQFLKPANSNNKDQQQPKEHSQREEETEELENQDLDLELLQAETAGPDPDTENNPDILKISNLDITVFVEKVSTEGSFDAKDPATWPTIINEDLRQTLVKKGFRQIKNFEYPSNEKKRRFNERFFIRRMPNGEMVPRKWLMYSVSADSLFCFCCKLFSNESTSWTKRGFDDWTHTSTALEKHEKNQKHLKAFSDWILNFD